MSIKEMIELVQQHHPHMGEKEIRKLLNRAMDNLTEATGILESSYTETTIANQRFYVLPEGLFKIQEVFLNGVRIPRTLTKPIINDYESEEDEI